MHNPEEIALDQMKRGGVDTLLTLPCDRVKALIALSDDVFFRLPLTREEEGVGIAAGAAMAGRRPAMILQSSGVGNLLNALLSLTQFYELPLPLFISQRGVFKEGIAAQVPMGKCLPALFDAVGIGWTELSSLEDLSGVGTTLRRVYEKSEIHAFLLSPALWESSEASLPPRRDVPCRCKAIEIEGSRTNPEIRFTRFEILKGITDVLRNRAVVCNLGIPAKELYEILPQDSNFYMLGSMGMATPLGLGVALATDKRVVVIDGDGSLLMNPGSLPTVALALPENLTIIAIDNASYGSTGNQPTLTGTCVDLELVARGFGIADTAKTADPAEIVDIVARPQEGPRFVHVPTLPGNAPVPNIPIDHHEIRRRFMRALGQGYGETAGT